MTKMSEEFRDTTRETPLGNEQVVIDTVHQRIHDGRFYTTSLIDLVLENNADLEILVRVVDAAHFRPNMALSGDAVGALYAGPTTSDDGSALTIQNRNQFSSRAATTLAFSGPTASAPGVVLDQAVMPGGSGPFAVGSDEGFGEWILDPGDYLVRLTNKAGATKPASIQLDWYERSAS